MIFNTIATFISQVSGSSGIYSLTQRRPEKVQVGHLAYFIYTKGTRDTPSGSTGLFIHIHKRGPKMVQVGHLAYSFIYTKGIRDGPSGLSSLFSYTKGDWRWSSSLLMCSKGPHKSEAHQCFVFLKT
jgi:hypothetical protein